MRIPQRKQHLCPDHRRRSRKHPRLASTVEKAFEGNGGNCEAAKKIGAAIAERALQKGIEEVVFDRGGYIYHGRVKALAEGAREGGLKF